MSGAIQGFDSPTLQPGNNVRDAAASHNVKGAYQGVAVTISTSTTSLVQDALEELTSSLSEKSEKDLAKRKVKDVMSDTQLQADKVNELMDAAFKIEKRQQLDELVNDLLGGKYSTSGALKEALREFGSDPSEQYLALMYIRRQLSQSSGNEAILQLVNQQLASLESTDKSRILAGFNSFIPAMEAENSGLGEFSELRGFYQDAVLDYQGLSGVWSSMVEQYGESRLNLATGFMLSALAADLDSSGSSIDGNKLVSIMDDMNRIKMLSGVYESCELIAAIIYPEGEQ